MKDEKEYLVGFYLSLQTVEHVLQLHIKDEFLDERFRRRYRYKELQELESKLMLIAGKAEKGKEDVDRFTMVK